MSNNKNEWTRRRACALLSALWSAVLLGACATPGGPAEGGGGRDPLERLNRAVYRFNDALDRYVLRPVAEGYDRGVPGPIKRAIDNVFANAFEPTVIINDLLQGKFERALMDTGRFVFNTTFGLLGIFDVATPMGLPRHNEDFGQTLAVWGVGEGPYIVLPLLGPSNLRDAIGLLPYYRRTYAPAYIDDREARWAVTTVDVINSRARLLDATRVLDSAALDPYVFVREAYRQRRRNLIYDGNPPLDYLEVE